MSVLRVELFHDEAGSWRYRVPALRIDGGSTSTREEAERDCLAAINAALRGGQRDTEPEAVTLNVSVMPTAPTPGASPPLPRRVKKKPAAAMDGSPGAGAR